MQVELIKANKRDTVTVKKSCAICEHRLEPYNATYSCEIIDMRLQPYEIFQKKCRYYQKRRCIND